MNIKPTLSGRFQISAVNADTGESRFIAEFENLILDTGLERLGVGQAINQCSVGSGSTAPVNTDTALQSFVATTSTIIDQTNGAQATAPYFGWQRWVFRFPLGAAAGNLSEVGIGWGSGLFSRALIKDSGGTPTTITVLSNEFLDVTYELRIYPPTTDSTNTVVIGGVTHTCVTRAALVTDSNYWSPGIMVANAASFGNSITGTIIRARNGSLGAITSSPSGSEGGGTYTNNAYSSNSKQKSALIAFGLDQGNLSGGISALLFNSSGGAYQISFSPAIAKDNTKELNLTVRYSWARGA